MGDRILLHTIWVLQTIILCQLTTATGSMLDTFCPCLLFDEWHGEDQPALQNIQKILPKCENEKFARYCLFLQDTRSSANEAKLLNVLRTIPDHVIGFKVVNELDGKSDIVAPFKSDPRLKYTSMTKQSERDENIKGIVTKTETATANEVSKTSSFGKTNYKPHSIPSTVKELPFNLVIPPKDFAYPEYTPETIEESKTKDVESTIYENVQNVMASIKANRHTPSVAVHSNIREIVNLSQDISSSPPEDIIPPPTGLSNAEYATQGVKDTINAKKNVNYIQSGFHEDTVRVQEYQSEMINDQEDSPYIRQLIRQAEHFESLKLRSGIKSRRVRNPLFPLDSIMKRWRSLIQLLKDDTSKTVNPITRLLRKVKLIPKSKIVPDITTTAMIPHTRQNELSTVAIERYDTDREKSLSKADLTHGANISERMDINLTSKTSISNKQNDENATKSTDPTESFNIRPVISDTFASSTTPSLEQINFESNVRTGITSRISDTKEREDVNHRNSIFTRRNVEVQTDNPFEVSLSKLENPDGSVNSTKSYGEESVEISLNEHKLKESERLSDLSKSKTVSENVSTVSPQSSTSSSKTFEFKHDSVSNDHDTKNMSKVLFFAESIPSTTENLPLSPATNMSQFSHVHATSSINYQASEKLKEPKITSLGENTDEMLRESGRNYSKERESHIAKSIPPLAFLESVSEPEGNFSKQKTSLDALVALDRVSTEPASISILDPLVEDMTNSDRHMDGTQNKSAPDVNNKNSTNVLLTNIERTNKVEQKQSSETSDPERELRKIQRFNARKNMSTESEVETVPRAVHESGQIKNVDNTTPTTSTSISTNDDNVSRIACMSNLDDPKESVKVEAPVSRAPIKKFEKPRRILPKRIYQSRKNTTRVTQRRRNSKVQTLKLFSREDTTRKKIKYTRKRPSTSVQTRNVANKQITYSSNKVERLIGDDVKNASIKTEDVDLKVMKSANISASSLRDSATTDISKADKEKLDNYAPSDVESQNGIHNFTDSTLKISTNSENSTSNSSKENEGELVNHRKKTSNEGIVKPDTELSDGIYRDTDHFGTISSPAPGNRH